MISMVVVETIIGLDKEVEEQDFPLLLHIFLSSSLF